MWRNLRNATENLSQDSRWSKFELENRSEALPLNYMGQVLVMSYGTNPYLLLAKNMLDKLRLRNF